ncbi:MAG: hypothetical protein ACP5VE_04135 [Chthonomonadales bacterium]
MKWLLLAAAGCLLTSSGTAAQQHPSQLFTTHFFDWYHVSSSRPYASYQRQWTYRPLWERYSIQPSEIGVSEHYYAVQMRMIRSAGFDGIHYEWYGEQPSEAFLRAIGNARMHVAMFYDQEIRFSGHPAFIKPTADYLASVLQDVTSFYARIPRHLWLREGDGSLPIIFYAYQFDSSFRNVKDWDHFYRSLLDGLRSRLGSPVHIYWTDAGAMPEVYAFQHFPEITSYTFGWWGGQTQINAKAATLVASYDDRGATVQGRAARTVVNDPLYLQLDLELARISNPTLVFNYGWNEFYEGEHIFPDATWGDWRLQALSAIVHDLKHQSPFRSPRVLILADDLFPRWLNGPQEPYEAERALLQSLRYLFPGARVVLANRADRKMLAAYQILIAINRDRTKQQEEELLECLRRGARVAFINSSAQSTGPLMALFAAGPRRPALTGVPLPPANQWVGASTPVDVDANRFPIFHIRVRNSPNTFYHVRFRGVDAQGTSYENHDNGSPLDWQTTGGGWAERTENAKEILEKFAGKPIVRITGVTVIVNGTGTSGDFHAEFQDGRFTGPNGEEGPSVPFGAANAWTPAASFANSNLPGMPWGGVGNQGGGILQLTLKARMPGDTPIDAATQIFALRRGVKVLTSAPFQKRAVPILLQSANAYCINSSAPTLPVYAALLPRLGLPAAHQVGFLTFQAVHGRVTANHPTAVTSLEPAELPLDWVRMVHLADMVLPAEYAYPVTSRPLAMVRTHSNSVRAEEVTTTVLPNSACSVPGRVRLQPGDTVDLYRLPIRVTPRSGVVQVRCIQYQADHAALVIMGRGRARVAATRRNVRILSNGRPVRAEVRLPCTLLLRGRLEWHSQPAAP